jgi:hypothetical protein
MSGFVSECFQIPAVAEALLVAEVSTPATEPSRIDPLLLSLQWMTVSARTVSLALDISQAMISRWAHGKGPIPSHRRKELIAVIGLAIERTKEAIRAAEQLPASPSRDATIAMMRARCAVGEAALQEEDARTALPEARQT